MAIVEEAVSAEIHSINEKIKSLELEVTILRKSNIDLIKLLTKNKDNKFESQHENLENFISSKEKQVKSHNQANKNLSPLVKRPFEKKESDTLSAGMSGSVIDKSEFTFANKLKSLDGTNKNDTSTTSKKRSPLIIGSGEQIINDNGEDFAVIKKIRMSTSSY
jgi:hypothetical protein